MPESGQDDIEYRHNQHPDWNVNTACFDDVTSNCFATSSLGS